MSVTLLQVIRLIQYGILFTAIVVGLVACGGGRDEPTPTVEVTAAAGGMVMPTPVNEPTIPVTPVAEPFMVGQLVQAIDELLLYVDAGANITADGNSVVMNQYASAAEFTVLAPNGDYTAYPVTVDGLQWYRLRAADGLVGWAIGDYLALLE